MTISAGVMNMTQQEFQTLVESLARTPESLRRMASALSDVELRWKPSDEEFSVIEHVCHLRDLEREGYGARVEKLLAEDAPFLPDIDGGRLASERRYNSQFLEESLADFTNARAENVGRLKNLSAPELERGGTLEHVGPVTLAELLLRMREHDHTHLRELEDLRRRLFERFELF